METKEYISVILPLKLEWTPHYYTKEEVQTGDRVRVTFAKKEYVGVVDSIVTSPEVEPEKIKEIISVERNLERIFKEEIKLWKKVAEYYLCSIGEVYKAAYPYRKTNIEQAHAESRRKVYQRRQKAIQAIDLRINRLEERLKKKTQLIQLAKNGTKAKASLTADIAKIQEDIAKAESARKTAEHNLESTYRHFITNFQTPVIDNIRLSAHQERAYFEISENFKTGKPVLLHGVTGSGKTEIYIKLAQKALNKGKNVLYLVPEIALSRQLEERLYGHFGDRLTVFHSGESIASRHHSAEVIRNVSGGAYIALCTRSGLFLPHHDLGLIIVDEEHDTSYKQDSPAPRYNGRDTALMLRQLHKDCDIILGSATPSMEETYNTMTGKHAIVRLTEKFHGSKDAEIEIIDTKAERKKNGMTGNFSRKLIEHIRHTLDERGQVLILRSRRAWSTALQCEDCGKILKCPHCNVSMSYHKANDRNVCHYCGHSTSHSDTCDKCGGRMKSLGAGTQRIEEEVSSLFPAASVARIDSDTAQNKANQIKIIKDFSKGDIDILVGTQIIAKGFDFNNISLVAIIAADTLLGLQDFRADEKALHLMEQFRGRSSRREKKGKFIIQTSQPDHPVYAQLKSGAKTSEVNLMSERKTFNFPPFSRIIELTIKDCDEDRLETISQELSNAIKQCSGISQETCHMTPSPVTGPYRPVIDKIADQFVRNIRICLKKDKELKIKKEALKRVISDFERKNRNAIHITIDVDPA